MVSVPAFLLRRLYVKGSLHNRPEGWGYRLKNGLGSGYAKGMLPLILDGVEIPMDAAFFATDDSDGRVAFADVNEKQTFGLKMGKVVSITVDGAPLAEGAHTIVMGFVVPGLGRMKFDFHDVPQAAPVD